MRDSCAYPIVIAAPTLPLFGRRGCPTRAAQPPIHSIFCSEQKRSAASPISTIIIGLSWVSYQPYSKELDQTRNDLHEAPVKNSRKKNKSMSLRQFPTRRRQQHSIHIHTLSPRVRPGRPSHHANLHTGKPRVNAAVEELELGSPTAQKAPVKAITQVCKQGTLLIPTPSSKASLKVDTPYYTRRANTGCMRLTNINTSSHQKQLGDS